MMLDMVTGIANLLTRHLEVIFRLELEHLEH